MILEEVMYQGMFCMIEGQGWLDLRSFFIMYVAYAKRNKKDIGGLKCVVFRYGKSYVFNLMRYSVLSFL